MNYWDLTSTKDKVIHLLCAAYVNDVYGQAIVECAREFGEELTNEAVNEFKTNYKTNLSKI